MTGPESASESRCGERECRRAVRQLLAQHCELVTAEPRCEVLGPYHRSETLPHHPKQLIAHRVPHRVIDLLEMVEIDEQHRNEAIVAISQRVSLHAPVAECGSVGR